MIVSLDADRSRNDEKILFREQTMKISNYFTFLVSFMPLYCLAECAEQKSCESSTLKLVKVSLHVSNQVSKLESIDIKVEIDNEVVVDEYFSSSGQHYYKRYTLNLLPGDHTMRIESEQGQAAMTQNVLVMDGLNIVVLYWGEAFKINIFTEEVHPW